MLRYFLDNLWRWKCGLPEQTFDYTPKPDLATLRITEWSSEFEEHMQYRLIMGALRYGSMGHGSIPRGKPRYSRADSIRKRITLFEETGNAEYLVDVANFALLLYEEHDHEEWHMRSIDDGIHDTIRE
jgi:hypothetical protein